MVPLQTKGPIKYQDGFKYSLYEDFWVQTPIIGEHARCPFVRLYADGTLFIEKGFAWDGPSGPTIDTKSSMRAALVHDAFYRLFSEGALDRKYRVVADKLLEDLGIQDGMFRWRARIWDRMVRLFAGGSAKHKRPVLTAP